MTSSTMHSSPPDLANVRHVHLVAVAGTAMGTLACMLAERGFRVTGSDTGAYPPMSDQLAAAGIPILEGFSAQNVASPRPDLAIIGNAVRRENPEAVAIVEAGIPYLSMADAIREIFIGERHSVVITGTHGKTTTTSLIGWILSAAGRDPSMLVGGVTQNFGKSYRLGEGPHFVIEGDEYDTAYFDKTPKFLHYAPRTVLFTSCEFDHGDIYDSIEDIERAFTKLMDLVPADGLVMAAALDPRVRAIAPHTRARVETYGVGDAVDLLWRATDLTIEPAGTRFRVLREGRPEGELRIPLFGRHNIENALGAVAICRNLGLELSEIAGALETFVGVKRRQEVRGTVSGCTVIDDFAHHPTEVRETIAAIRGKHPGDTLWAIFEPRTNTSRRRFFEDEYVEAFTGADRVVIAGVHDTGKIPEDERMRPERVAAALRERGVEASYIERIEDIVEHFGRSQRGADVALVMSNGAFGGIWDRLLARVADTKESQDAEHPSH